MSQKIFCPSCGKEMVFQDKLYKQYRLRRQDIFYGCEACNQCWQIKDSGKMLSLCTGTLSLWLKYAKDAEDQKAEEKRKRDAKPGIESLNSSGL